MADKEVCNNYYNIPAKLNKNEVLIYYSLCENTNFTLNEYEGREKFECFCSIRTLSEDNSLSTRIVSNSLKKLEEGGYIQLISKGKPPKTPSKYKLIYAENIKKSVTLNVPLNETLGETLQNIENKGINGSCETLGVTMSETLSVTPSKDISKDKSNNIDSSKYIEEIIEYLNLKANTRYRANSKKTKDSINARLKEKYTVEDFKIVIDKKVNEWINNPKMSKYLRPETLFGNKFEGYLNQIDVAPEDVKSHYDSCELLSDDYIDY